MNLIRIIRTNKVWVEGRTHVEVSPELESEPVIFHHRTINEVIEELNHDYDDPRINAYVIGLQFDAGRSAEREDLYDIPVILCHLSDLDIKKINEGQK